jgi:hypothetical protein
MFGVPKYSAALEKIRQERNVTGLFNHNLVSIDNAKKVATFATGPDGKTSEQEFEFLHVVPPQGAPDFLKGSPIGASPLHFLTILITILFDVDGCIDDVL